MEDCLICGEEKKDFKEKCKMCGMGLGKKAYKYKNHVFCSDFCRKIFRKLFEMSDLNAKKELKERNVII